MIKVTQSKLQNSHPYLTTQKQVFVLTRCLFEWSSPLDMSGSDTTTSLHRHIIMFWLQAVMSQWRWQRGGREQTEAREKTEVSTTWTGATGLQMWMAMRSLQKAVWVMAMLSWNKFYIYTPSCIRIHVCVCTNMHVYWGLRRKCVACHVWCIEMKAYMGALCKGQSRGYSWQKSRRLLTVFALLLKVSPNTTHMPAEPSWTPYPIYNIFQEWFLPLINKNFTGLPRCLYFTKSIARYEKNQICPANEPWFSWFERARWRRCGEGSPRPQEPLCLWLMPVVWRWILHIKAGRIVVCFKYCSLNTVADRMTAAIFILVREQGTLWGVNQRLLNPPHKECNHSKKMEREIQCTCERKRLSRSVCAKEREWESMVLLWKIFQRPSEISTVWLRCRKWGENL